MNRIVREHYPASKLPDELREGIHPERTVTVTVTEEEGHPERPMTLEEILALRQPPYLTADEIDRSTQNERDAWDG